MCDTLIKANVKAPQFAYKIVSKVGSGKKTRYYSTVMGAQIPRRRWIKAPEIPAEAKGKSFNLAGYLSLLESWAKSEIFNDPCSGEYSGLHDGKWNALAYQDDCEPNSSQLNNNIANSRQVIVKVKLRGECHKTRYSGNDAYLAEEMIVVEEVANK